MADVVAQQGELPATPAQERLKAGPVRSQWLLSAIEAVSSIMCSAAPQEFKLQAACACLVDQMMASAVWLTTSASDVAAPTAGSSRLTVIASEHDDEALRSIVQDHGLNELLLRRLAAVVRQCEQTFEPVQIRRFDALGVQRDLVAVPLALSGRVFAILSCLLRPEISRHESDIVALELIGRLLAMSMQAQQASSTAQLTRLEDGRRDSARLRALARTLPGAVTVFDSGGVARERLEGSPAASILPLSLLSEVGWRFRPSDDDGKTRLDEALRRAQAGTASSCQFEVVVPGAARESAQTIEQLFCPVEDEDGNVGEVIGYAQCLTEKLALSERLRLLRDHDRATDCMTMDSLRDQAAVALAQFEQHRTPLVFMTIEIEKAGAGFHLLGNGSFEELLQTVVARIRRQLPRSHILARRGDQSFVAMARLLDGPQAAAASADRIVQVLCDPMVTGRHEYCITAHVGHSVFPQDGGTLDEMLYNADIAAMSAARRRHNSAVAFAPRLATQANEQVRIETALHRAVDHEEFDLAYQPKVDLHTGQVCGAEALIRWPGRHNIGPAQFIPIAEECGLIGFIGEWALRHACKTVARWSKNGLRLPVSVNVSTRQFQDSDFHDIVEEILRETQADPALIELEVTEGVMIRNPELAVDRLHKLKRLGVALSIDDFGTGFSSLAYLKTLPVDKLKIDRAFISGLPVERSNEAITKAILAMAKAMTLRTVAEGVEDVQCLKHLRALGCDEIQGYYFSRPLFEREFLNWYGAYQAVQQARRPVDVHAHEV